jgi:hypothetical protein
MAVSLHHASPPDFFERHIRRLAWYALLASIALLVPIVRTSASTDLNLVGALGALVIVVVVLTVVRDVGRYVRREQARRAESASAAEQTGACLAAATIHDRIANLLSVTVGYVELLAESEQLSPEARDQAERAVQAALSATRAVSGFKESLGCAAETGDTVALAAGGLRVTSHDQRLAFRPGETWVYEPHSRTMRSRDGVVVASISPTLDRTSAMTAGRLLAESPVMFEVLGDVQHLGATLLSNGTASRQVEVELRTVLDRINTLASQVQP